MMVTVPLRSTVRVVLVRCALVAALPLAGGCAMQYSARSLGVPVTMAEPLAQPVAGDSFNITLHAVHYFWGLAPGKMPSLQRALAGQLGAGGGVHSLTIRSRKQVSDVIFTVITLGLISPTSVTYQGVVTHGTP
jgi:hypothetical protein